MFCGLWTHGGVCAEIHMQSHVVPNIGRGLHRQAAAERRAEELAAGLERQRSARASSSQSSYPATAQPQSLGPEEDLMRSFHENRPQSVAILAQTPLGRKRTAQQKRNRRIDRQGESSAEEGLEVADYCTACGSEECFVPPAECRELGRRRLLPAAL